MPIQDCQKKYTIYMGSADAFGQTNPAALAAATELENGFASPGGLSALEASKKPLDEDPPLEFSPKPSQKPSLKPPLP